jgi:hypothetical protein
LYFDLTSLTIQEEPLRSLCSKKFKILLERALKIIQSHALKSLKHRKGDFPPQLPTSAEEVHITERGRSCHLVEALKN